MSVEKEAFKKSRMPERPAEAMADKGKGKKSATPALPSSSGGHVPVRGESVRATVGTTHKDGMAKMAAMGTESRAPVRAPSHSNSTRKPSRNMGG